MANKTTHYEVFDYWKDKSIDKHGLWRNFDGTWNPVFDQLSEGLSRNLPMEDSELYREGGKQWFSAAPSKETLKHWFSLTDVLELQKLGYKIYEFQLVDTKQISDFEIVFTRDNIVEQREINYKEIWND